MTIRLKNLYLIDFLQKFKTFLILNLKRNKYQFNYYFRNGFMTLRSEKNE